MTKEIKITFTDDGYFKVEITHEQPLLFEEADNVVKNIPHMLEYLKSVSPPNNHNQDGESDG